MFDYKFNDNNVFKDIDKYLCENTEEDKPSCICIGCISFDDIISETEIGNSDFKSIGKCKIEVYAGEGPMPHMHIFNTNNSFKTCICIFENKYFTHGKYKDKFNSKQCKQFNDWIKSINADGILNWNGVVNAWKLLNKIPKQYENITIPPDYTKIL